MAQLADIVNIFCQTKEKTQIHLPRLRWIYNITLQDGREVGGYAGGAG